MKLVLGLLIATLALTGCSVIAPSVPSNTPGTFSISSPTFSDGATLQTPYAGSLSSNPNCVGQNISPALLWRDPPPLTKSFAFLVYDQEGRNGLGVVHWVAYGISPHVRGFDEGEISKTSEKYVGGKSTLNLASYMGPCPPANTGLHHYVYMVIALDIESNLLPRNLTMQELLEKVDGRALGASSLVFRYGRP